MINFGRGLSKGIGHLNNSSGIGHIICMWNIPFNFAVVRVRRKEVLLWSSFRNAWWTATGHLRKRDTFAKHLWRVSLIPCSFKNFI